MSNISETEVVTLETTCAQDAIDAPQAEPKACDEYTSISIHRQDEQDSIRSIDKLFKAVKRHIVKLVLISSTAICITLVGMVLSYVSPDTRNTEIIKEITKQTMNDLFLPLETNAKQNSTISIR